MRRRQLVRVCVCAQGGQEWHLEAVVADDAEEGDDGVHDGEDAQHGLHVAAALLQDEADGERLQRLHGLIAGLLLRLHALSAGIPLDGAFRRAARERRLPLFNRGRGGRDLERTTRP